MLVNKLRTILEKNNKQLTFLAFTFFRNKEKYLGFFQNSKKKQKFSFTKKTTVICMFTQFL